MRPVREQLEHDRVIRLLQAKYRRKFEVAINPGHEQTMPVAVGTSPWYPDLVLQSADRGRRILGTIEVETAESVNNLEAMSQWATFSRLRAPFRLYVPASSLDTAKRLCVDLKIAVAELWAYNSLGDQMRFTLVQRSTDGKVRAAGAPRGARPAKGSAAAGRARSRRTAAARKGVKRRTGAGKTASRSSRAQKRK